jgi:hypothetical protein
MFRLYYAPGTCALATHIALEEAGAPYEAVPVDFGAQAQRSPEYLAVNPKGRSRAGDRKRHAHRNPRIAALRGAAFSGCRTRAALGSVRPGAGSGVQQLSLLDRARRARAHCLRSLFCSRIRGCDRGGETADPLISRFPDDLSLACRRSRAVGSRGRSEVAAGASHFLCTCGIQDVRAQPRPVVSARGPRPPDRRPAQGGMGGMMRRRARRRSKALGASGQLGYGIPEKSLAAGL